MEQGMGAYGTGPVVFPGYFTEIGFCTVVVVDQTG